MAASCYVPADKEFSPNGTKAAFSKTEYEHIFTELNST